MAHLADYIPSLLTLCVIGLSLAFFHWVLIRRNTHLTSDQRLPRQLIMLLLTFVSVIAFVLSLPLSEAIQNQILALIGILLSGVIAFSSTTIVSNVMAGLVLRFNKPFRLGDFVRVNGFSGRVAEMGLLETEIQTETRELIAFANTILINSPVTVVRSSGAIVSVELSLGYEIHHSKVEQHLLQAGTEAGLEEPFVQVISLGDFSVTYRIAGLLTDVKSMISARSKLHKAVLDCLHSAKIEIVSPTFVNSRPQPDDRVMIPVRQRIVQVNEPDAPRPEDILFDKAEEAEAIQRDKMTVEAELAAIQEQLSGADSEQKDALKTRRDELKAQLAELATPVKEEAEQSESGPGIIKSPDAE
ncbi:MULTISPECIES: mechanosensitive ion channel family protein [Marisediminitalea]|jgi:small-conductance mechanosensitive channel|uniref:mechanosensitive ion channel family protein n=1 Tax=Marisediminitalea TaxID=2662254 RepID=UPI0020CF9D94|nr:mechanosensitive ion channel family protein [Marisediminitalea aggregata]MCP3864601.1 mechanosensitive ion channel family protein [Aestuariibacter sp.]MCP4949326.1 mechanosensitive ion channel family protein [Aestuariibacter sp.]MCP9479025.1 mechanosensitive ion channel family protein [Marisediminitalea aggregata]